MKAILLCLLFCSTVSAYEFENIQLLQPRVTWHCDDPVLADSFQRMFAIWNAVLDQRFDLTQVDADADVTIRAEDLRLFGFAGDTSLQPIGARLTAIVCIDEAASEGVLDRVVLHEIGHVLGMNHSEDSGAVMYPQAGYSKAALDNDDIVGICTRYGVSLPSSARTCIAFRRIGHLKYKFELMGLSSDAESWTFSDGSATGIVPVHTFAKKGVTTVTVHLGAFVETFTLPVK